MKYDLNVTATQMIRVEAETEAEAKKEAFYQAFGKSENVFANVDIEIISVDGKYT